MPIVFPYHKPFKKHFTDLLNPFNPDLESYYHKDVLLVNIVR